MLPRASWFAPFSLPKGRLIKNWPLFYEPFKGVNKVIGLAPVKDHHRSGASLTMKNWYGLLGGERSIFHQDIYGIITELAMMIKPTLVILDGVQSMMTNGPTGGSVSDLKATEHPDPLHGPGGGRRLGSRASGQDLGPGSLCQHGRPCRFGERRTTTPCGLSGPRRDRKAMSILTARRISQSFFPGAVYVVLPCHRAGGRLVAASGLAGELVFATGPACGPGFHSGHRHALRRAGLGAGHRGAHHHPGPILLRVDLPLRRHTSLLGWLGLRRKNAQQKAEANQYHPGQAVKYYVLVFYWPRQPATWRAD